MLQAELSGDQAAVSVLEAAEAQVEGELNEELEKLAEKQIEEQAALEVKQVEELINMEEELRAEQQTAGQQVADQIEEQKQKVGNESIPSPPPKLFSSIRILSIQFLSPPPSSAVPLDKRSFYSYCLNYLLYFK